MEAVTVIAQENGAAGFLGGLLPLLLIFAVFYLLLIRPQQQRAKRHRQLVRSIETNDRVVTIGGVHGTVQSVNEETLRLEIAPGTVITVARQAVSRRLIDADTAAGEETGG
ncbi:MAG TPA: preprotein translocase subunit YajC [Egibacteraceae bacterium]|nr:preprotein translocase subunit YajC [Egibacteraceae bacterium]